MERLPSTTSLYTFSLLPSVPPLLSTPGLCRFNLMTWNVLAQRLVKRDMYPSAKKNTLRWAHRFALMKQYLTDLHADVVCLQEVDSVENMQTVFPGYAVASAEKANGKHSCCIFWNPSLFTCLRQAPVLLRPTRENIPDAPTLGNTAIVVWLQHRSGQTCIVSNHHLYWAPNGSYLRLHQLEVLLKFLTTENHLNVPVFICGDFNFMPTHPEYTILVKEAQKEELLQQLRRSNEETDSELFDLLQSFYPFPPCHSMYADYQSRLPKPPLPLSSLEQGGVGEPAFTNYTEGFKGTLDYLFWMDVKQRVHAHQLLKIPEAQVLDGPENGLPNLRFPSDHLPLLADVEILPYAKSPRTLPPTHPLNHTKEL